MLTYTLDDFYVILKVGPPLVLPAEIHSLISSLNSSIVPLLLENNSHTNQKKDKKDFRPNNNNFALTNYKKHKKNTKPTENWEELCPMKPTNIVEKPDGIEKWTDTIRIALNKLSLKNYDTQRDIIIGCVDKCVNEENLKHIGTAIFNIASTNKFYAELYAQLYKELIIKSDIFNDIVLNNLVAYSNNIKEITYIEPEVDYEQFCINNKTRDSRKATAVFMVQLMKLKVVPALRILNVMADIQKLILEYVNTDNKTNEVDELTDILFLFLQEGKDVFIECKAEWVWKFVITQNIEKLSKYTKKEKKSLSTRAVFKFADMMKII